MTETLVAHRSSAHRAGECYPSVPPLCGLEGHRAVRVRCILGLGALRSEGRSRRLLLLLLLRRIPAESQ